MRFTNIQNDTILAKKKKTTHDTKKRKLKVIDFNQAKHQNSVQLKINQLIKQSTILIHLSKAPTCEL